MFYLLKNTETSNQVLTYVLQEISASLKSIAINHLSPITHMKRSCEKINTPHFQNNWVIW